MATELETYIRRAAAARGIDPDIAVRVAKSEGGLDDPTRQSLVRKNGLQEPSYGPFQLLVGDGRNFPRGMGNDFVAKYGMHPSDPQAAYKGIDFALDNAKQSGWGAWYGAKAAGINKFDGINGRAVADGPKGQEAYTAPRPADAPIIGSMAPQIAGPSPAVPQYVQEVAAGGGREPQKDSPLSYLQSLFGSMGQQQEAPPPQPQFQQNPESANALLNLAQALRGRLV